MLRGLLFLSALAILVVPAGEVARADGTALNWYSVWRLPWTEGLPESRNSGCGVGEPNPASICFSGHGAGTANHWNLDIGTMSLGEPVRAVGGGTIVYGLDPNGLGQYAIVTHAGLQWTSLYAHMCFGSIFTNGQVVHQGDFIGYTGNTGLTSGGGAPCSANNPNGVHLHFGVRLNGVAQNVQLSGYGIDHISADQWTAHESNNTGPGYLFPTFYNVWFRNKYTALNGSPGSTLRPTSGYCGYQSRWVHDCNVYYWGNLTSQNFMGSGNNPNALVQGLYDVNRVWGALWYTYTIGATQGNWIAEWMGKPTTDEFGPCYGSYEYTCQNFQGGFIVKILSYFPALYQDAWACRPQWVPQCQWIASFAYGDQ